MLGVTLLLPATVAVMSTTADATVASRLDACYPASAGNWGGGWCDGTGPNFTYQGFVDCTDNHEYYGTERWAGDRRASYGTCPAGKQAVQGGLDVFLNGYWYDSYIVPAA
jgi:hypothetical protein